MDWVRENWYFCFFVAQVLGEIVPFDYLRMLAGDERLNMTLLALNLSGHVNGVAKKHGEVSQAMFPGYPIDSITNGIHALTWTCDSFRRLFNKERGMDQDHAAMHSRQRLFF